MPDPSPHESAADDRGPKVPRDPEHEEWVTPPPTPAVIAAYALSDWIAGNPRPNACGVRSFRHRDAVEVYWKGTPPVELRELADNQEVPVAFIDADYSLDELDPIAKRLVTEHRDIVDSAGPSRDYSGVSVMLKSRASSAALAQLRAETEVPVVVDGIGDSVPLGRS